MDSLHFTWTEAREDNFLRRESASVLIDNGNHLLLLYELTRERIGVGRHIHTTSESVALVIHNDLLDDELGGLERSRSRCTTNVSRPDRGDRIQLNCNLNLLSEKVGRERVSLTYTRRDIMRKSEDYTCILIHSERRSGCTWSVVASEGEEIISGLTRGLSAESVLEDLRTAQEVLRRATITEGHLLDKSVAPTTREGKTRVRSYTSNHHLKNNVLNTHIRGDCEDGRATRKVLELLDELGVLRCREALFLRSFPIVVIKIHALARSYHRLNWSRHTIFFSNKKNIGKEYEDEIRTRRNPLLASCW